MKKFIRHYKNRILGFPKTVYFNIKYFGLRGLKFPVLIGYKVKLINCKGKIIFENGIKKGNVIIGYTRASIFSYDEISVWNCLGTVIFKGTAIMGVGTRIFVDKNAQIIFGDKFEITSNSSIICENRICFGYGCLISWDVQIMDTDAHQIFSSDDNNKISTSKPIEIGNHVWIGSRCMIFKGVYINDNCVISAGSIIRKSVRLANSLVFTYNENKALTKINWK